MWRPCAERRRLSAGNNLQNAQRMAIKFNDWLMEGKDPESEMEKAKQIERARKITLKELFPVFIEWHGSKQMANIVEFAIYSGFRKENILGLKIESIKFHDLTPTGEAELVIKGGRTEKFPLYPLAIEVLKRAIGNREKGYVFLNPHTNTRYYSILKTFDRAVRKTSLTVGGKKLRFHDLRHVFATWLHKSGVSLDIVRLLLGHRDRETTDRYVTYDPMHYRNVLNVIPKID